MDQAYTNIGHKVGKKVYISTISRSIYIFTWLGPKHGGRMPYRSCVQTASRGLRKWARIFFFPPTLTGIANDVTPVEGATFRPVRKKQSDECT